MHIVARWPIEGRRSALGSPPSFHAPVAMLRETPKEATVPNRRFWPVMAAGAAAALCFALPAWSQELPEGKGKELVAAHCNSCHPFYARVGAGYTPRGWVTVMRMMTNHGVTVPADQVATITEYLTKNFPEKAKPAGVVIPGPAKVSIKEWTVPTPGSRPHDPLATADGSLWYTGQMNNVLGRLDPKTGRFKEYPLKMPHSGPHGLVEDRDGNIWYTGNTGALVGRLDPKSGAVTEYTMPDPDAKDPHTLIFDQSGILWFTVQNANRVGWLDPKTGEIKLLTPPTAKSRPYGMAVNSKGTGFYVAFGTNKVGSVDPKTLEIREYPLPDAASRPRGDQRHHLVQRVRNDAEYGRALRSQDGEVSELGDPGWRQHCAQHLGDAGRRLRAGQQPRECRHAGENREVRAECGPRAMSSPSDLDSYSVTRVSSVSPDS